MRGSSFFLYLLATWFDFCQNLLLAESGEENRRRLQPLLTSTALSTAAFAHAEWEFTTETRENELTVENVPPMYLLDVGGTVQALFEKTAATSQLA